MLSDEPGGLMAPDPEFGHLYFVRRGRFMAAAVVMLAGVVICVVGLWGYFQTSGSCPAIGLMVVGAVAAAIATWNLRHWATKTYVHRRGMIQVSPFGVRRLSYSDIGSMRVRHVRGYVRGAYADSTLLLWLAPVRSSPGRAVSVACEYREHEVRSRARTDFEHDEPFEDVIRHITRVVAERIVRDVLEGQEVRWGRAVLTREGLAVRQWLRPRMMLRWEEITLPYLWYGGLDVTTEGGREIKIPVKYSETNHGAIGIATEFLSRSAREAAGRGT